MITFIEIIFKEYFIFIKIMIDEISSILLRVRVLDSSVICILKKKTRRVRHARNILLLEM